MVCLDEDVGQNLLSDVAFVLNIHANTVWLAGVEYSQS